MEMIYKQQTLADAITSAMNQNKRNRHATLLLINLKNKIINGNVEYMTEIEYLQKLTHLPGILNLINNFCVPLDQKFVDNIEPCIYR